MDAQETFYRNAKPISVADSDRFPVAKAVCVYAASFGDNVSENLRSLNRFGFVVC